MSLPDIPQEWIKNYVERLISVAKELPENGVMQNALVLRADAVLDMVTAFRESAKSSCEHGPSVTG